MLNTQKGEHVEPEENAAEEKIPKREKQDSGEKEFFPTRKDVREKSFFLTITNNTGREETGRNQTCG